VVEQPGTVMAYEETQLFARVPGYVGKVHFDIGQKVSGPTYDARGKPVKPGQVMAELSVPEMVAEADQKKALVRQAKADVEQATKALASAEAGIASKEAFVVEARANKERWESESKRIAELVKKGVIDTQARDETANQFKAAAARLLSAEAVARKARADRDKASADVRSAEARVAVAEADARRQEALLSYATIRAPYDGVVTRRLVNTGDFVQPGGPRGECLFTVARLDPVRVVVAVPEADAALVREKVKATLTIPALAGRDPTGTVSRTSWALEPGTRTLRAEIDLPNKDGRLRPGMYVRARITGRLPEAWSLPAAAVAKQGDTTVCFLVKGGKVVRTPVQVGRTDGEFAEVLKWQKPGSPPSWEEWTGKEAVAARASGLSDGQSVKPGSAGK
jgi:multidrug efflux pump subunit AcrA (membrane-fusion protein)